MKCVRVSGCLVSLEFPAGFSIDRLLADLRDRLKGRVGQAFVFGSLARGEGSFRPDSDVDLIVIKDVTSPFLQRADEFSDLYDLCPDLDLLVYTPQEFAQLTAEPRVGFWKSVVDEMRPLLP